MRIRAVKLAPSEMPGPDLRIILDRLPPDLAGRISRFRKPEDAMRSAMGHMLILFTASQTLGVTDRELVLARNPHGKPSFRDFPELHFNLSHSGAWVVAIFGRSPVGIDVQETGSPDLALARRFFSPGEQRALEACGEAERTRLFFDLWTLKESYVKALGKGLSIPLDSFTLRMKEPDPIAYGPDGPLPFCFRRYALASKYALAACAAAPGFPEDVECLSRDTVWSGFMECTKGSSRRREPTR